MGSIKTILPIQFFPYSDIMGTNSYIKLWPLYWFFVRFYCFTPFHCAQSTIDREKDINLNNN